MLYIFEEGGGNTHNFPKRIYTLYINKCLYHVFNTGSVYTSVYISIRQPFPRTWHDSVRFYALEIDCGGSSLVSFLPRAPLNPHKCICQTVSGLSPCVACTHGVNLGTTLSRKPYNTPPPAVPSPLGRSIDRYWLYCSCHVAILMDPE